MTSHGLSPGINPLNLCHVAQPWSGEIGWNMLVVTNELIYNGVSSRCFSETAQFCVPEASAIISSDFCNNRGNKEWNLGFSRSGRHVSVIRADLSKLHADKGLSDSLGVSVVITAARGSADQG